jgi:DNA adenine methylase
MLEVSNLLKGRVTFRVGDWLETISDAEPTDLIYMDPPYLGTSAGRDKRYHKQLEFEKLCSGLDSMTERGLRFALSYDGATGKKVYGPRLPEELNLRRVELVGGLSSQATLNGKREVSVESLYLSPEMNGVKEPTKMTQASLLSV